jgi:hypothetical protein
MTVRTERPVANEPNRTRMSSGVRPIGQLMPAVLARYGIKFPEAPSKTPLMPKVGDAAATTIGELSPTV